MDNHNSVIPGRPYLRYYSKQNTSPPRRGCYQAKNMGIYDRMRNSDAFESLLRAGEQDRQRNTMLEQLLDLIS